MILEILIGIEFLILLSIICKLAKLERQRGEELASYKEELGKLYRDYLESLKHTKEKEDEEGEKDIVLEIRKLRG